MNRRLFGIKAGIAGVLSTVVLLPSLQAQTAYPTRPVELVVGHAPGGGSDILAREFALASAKHLPQPMVVMNKPGAVGVIAMTDVLNSKPEGYKIMMLDVNAVIMPNMGLTKITFEDFTPIARLNFDPSAITVRADAPWNTVEEFLAAAKKGDIRIGNGGNGSIWHLAVLRRNARRQLKLNNFTIRPIEIVLCSIEDNFENKKTISKIISEASLQCDSQLAYSDPCNDSREIRHEKKCANQKLILSIRPNCR